MPNISEFFGIQIRMYWNDHLPPHFHALYGDNEVTVAIRTLEPLTGWVPNRVLGLVLEWAALHRLELELNWRRAEGSLPFERIPPLE